MLTLYVPRALVAQVDRALAREGLTVFEALHVQGCAPYLEVRLGTPVPGIPRLLAHDGPDMPT